jgi:hypothetical protein
MYAMSGVGAACIFIVESQFISISFVNFYLSLALLKAKRICRHNGISAVEEEK